MSDVPEPTFKNSDDAFQDAIDAGRLSAHSPAANYAGDYMYMGTWDGVDAFKHIATRRYLKDRLPPEQEVE